MKKTKLCRNAIKNKELKFKQEIRKVAQQTKTKKRQKWISRKW